MWRRAVRGNVLALGLVSCLTDVSSEMIYPLLPVFFVGLASPAAAAVWIGAMEGLAESVASLLKILAGRWSDATRTRKPWALAGYGISTVARPLTALAAAPWHVVALRTLDRVGKGLRTSPRDALISGSVDRGVSGTAFAFHRMLDHAGAVAGPLLAAGFLWAFLGGADFWGSTGAREMRALRWLFGLALLPGLVAMAVLWRRVREVAASPASTGERGPKPARFYVFLAAVTLFTLGNSSDLFLVFYAQTRFGRGPGFALALWVTLHLAKIASSLPGGRLADTVGRRGAILLGWAVYAATYLAVPRVGSAGMLWGLLVVYGAYYGLTEGAERALVADYVPRGRRGRAYGLYHGAVGFATLPASLLFGVFWAALGPHRAFTIGAALAVAAMAVLAWLVRLERRAFTTT